MKKCAQDYSIGKKRIFINDYSGERLLGVIFIDKHMCTICTHIQSSSFSPLLPMASMVAGHLNRSQNLSV